jgi:hypothetical protein
MSGIVLVGILSGMIFGAFATIVRPYASTIILTPVILAPLVFLFMWRDALIGHCFLCQQFRHRSLYADARACLHDARSCR